MSADLHTLTGAYAAHALSDTERQAFERHLEACPACAQEVRELEATTARLGAAAASPPPPELWDRIRAEALVTRQLPPVVGRAERRRRAGRRGTAAGRRVPPLLAAAAALLVAVLSVTALNLGLLGRADRADRTADLVAAVLAAPDARRSPPSPVGPARPPWSCRASVAGPCSWPTGCRRRRRTGPTSSGW